MGMFEDLDKEDFIKREDTVEVFQNWLLTTDVQEPSVLFFYDKPAEDNKKGGIGKSWLLQQCVQKVADYPDIAVVMVDFFNIRDRSGIEIALRIVEALQKVFPQWNPETFHDVLARMEQATRGNGVETAFPSRRALRQALLKDLATLPISMDGSRKRLIVFCDTYERVQMHPVQISLSAEHLFPDLYDLPWLGFVIAGRDKPDEELFNWRGRAVRTVPVGPFTKEEMLLYVRKYLDVSSLLSLIEAHAEVLIERTGGGRPILVGLMTDMFNRRIVGLEELLTVPPPKFEEALVLYLNRLDGPVTWAVLFMAHIYHRFRRDILDVLFREHNLWPNPSVPLEVRLNDVWTQLKALSSVRSSTTGEEIVLHDEMRRLVRAWNLQSGMVDESMLQALSKTMIEYYDRLLEKTTDIPLVQAYEVEKLYHQCYLDLASGFTIFLEKVQSALQDQQNIYARSLIQEMDEFKERFSSEQIFHINMQDANLLQKEEYAEKALLIYEELNEQQAEKAELKDEDRASLFYEWGICLTTVSRFTQAIYLLTNALEIYDGLGNASRSALISVRLGFAYRRQGDLDAAVRCYQQSLNTYRIRNNHVGQVDSLNALGEVYLLQGKYDQALLICASALQRRQELFARRQATARGIAFVQSNMGKIYYALKNITQAEIYFQQAYCNYENISSQEGIAASYYYFGLLDLEKEKLDEACKWFELASKLARSFYPDIEIMSLMRWGLACFLRKETQEAWRLLRTASEQAAALNDFYQQALVQLYLAAVLLREFPFEHNLPMSAQDEEEATLLRDEQLEEAQIALEKAEKLATTYRYYQVLGWIMKVRGDRFLRGRDYTQAFFCYVDYCYFMAKYNNGEYSIARRYTIMEVWMSLPLASKREVYIQMKDDWYLRDLPEDIHALMRQDLEAAQAFVDF